MPAASGNSDLAVGASEPSWLKTRRYDNPPAYRTQPAALQVTVSVDAQNQRIVTPSFIFNPWSANLSDSDRAVLERIATLMNEKPNEVPRLEVASYTDTSGDPAINEALTIARANVVKAYLILKGVGVHRLDAKGYGDRNPVESNETKAGRAKNRRVEFKILKK